jgi:hypothetical protein
MANSDVRLIASSEDYCVGRWRTLSLIVWKRAAPMEGAVVGEKELRDLNDRYPGRCGLLTVVEEGSSLPSAEVRAEFVRVMSELTGIVWYALIFEGSGLKETVIRATVTMINLFSGIERPARVFSSVEAAAPWFAECLSGSSPNRVLPAEVVDAVATLRALDQAQTINKGA